MKKSHLVTILGIGIELIGAGIAWLKPFYWWIPISLAVALLGIGVVVNASSFDTSEERRPE